MAAAVSKPLSEAEAYVAEAGREISERLQQLLRQHRRRRGEQLIQAAADNPVVTLAAFVVGAILAALVAERLTAGPR